MQPFLLSLWTTQLHQYMQSIDYWYSPIVRDKETRRRSVAQLLLNLYFFLSLLIFSASELSIELLLLPLSGLLLNSPPVSLISAFCHTHFLYFSLDIAAQREELVISVHSPITNTSETMTLLSNSDLNSCIPPTAALFPLFSFDTLSTNLVN